MGTIYSRESRRETSRRAFALEGCRGRLDKARFTLEEISYPRLTGRYRGTEVELCMAVDTIQLRKLPVLWLMVTVYRNLPVPGVLDKVADHLRAFVADDRSKEMLITPRGVRLGQLQSDDAGSFLCRALCGGFMIHAIAFMDAYRMARFRWQAWKSGGQKG